MSDQSELSADMRLLDWQRHRMGLAQPAKLDWHSETAPEMGGALVAEEILDRSGSLLTVAITGTPLQGLIPGAVATLAIALHNEGPEAVHGVRVIASLPGSTQLRLGTLNIDQVPRSDAQAEKLIAAGLDLGDLAPSQRVGISFKIDVRPGLDPLVFAPTIKSRDGAVVTGPPAILRRSATTAQNAFVRNVIAESARAEASAPETPFYELDVEEEIHYEALDAALSPFAPPPLVPPPLVPPPLVTPVGIAIDTEPAAAPLQRASDIEPASVRAPQPARATRHLGEGVLLCGALESGVLTLLQRLLATKGLGLLPHFVISNALACPRVKKPGDSELTAYFAAENARLQRALVQRRLKRPLNVTDFSAPIPSIAGLRANFGRADAVDVLRPTRGLTLFTLLAGADLDFLARMPSSVDAAAFLRARQFAVVLLAHDAAQGDELGNERAATALQAYGALLKGRINALFIKMKLDTNASPLGEEDHEADLAAQLVLDALGALLAA